MAERFASLGVSGGFDPTQISNLVLYLDSISGNDFFLDTNLTVPISATSRNVFGWRDRSVRANHGKQVTMGQEMFWQPSVVLANNAPAVESDGTDDHIIAGTSTSDFDVVNGTGHTHFFVFILNPALSLRYLASNTPAGLTTSIFNGFGWDCYIDGTSSPETLYFRIRDTANNNTAVFFTTGFSGIPFVVSITHNWTTLKLYINGVNVDNAATNTFGGNLTGGTGSCNVGINGNLAQPFWQYHLAQLMYKKVLTAKEHNDVGRFFAGRYGITWTDL